MIFCLVCSSAHLKQQLIELQQESEEQHRASRREAMKLRDQLQQVYQERDDARTQAQRLGDAVEAAAAAKVSLQVIKITLCCHRFSSQTSRSLYNKAVM